MVLLFLFAGDVTLIWNLLERTQKRGKQRKKLCLVQRRIYCSSIACLSSLQVGSAIEYFNSILCFFNCCDTVVMMMIIRLQVVQSIGNGNGKLAQK